MASMIACKLVPPPETNTAMETGFAMAFSSGTNRRASDAVADFTDDKCRFAHFLEHCENAIGTLLADYENHAESVVERPVHFALDDAAEFLNQREHRRHRPTAALDNRRASLRQYPR